MILPSLTVPEALRGLVACYLKQQGTWWKLLPTCGCGRKAYLGWGKGGASGEVIACLIAGGLVHLMDRYEKAYPWRRKWQPTPVFLPGEPQGQRSLVGYIVHRVAELDTTEWIEYIYIWKGLDSIINNRAKILPLCVCVCVCMTELNNNMICWSKL